VNFPTNLVFNFNEWRKDDVYMRVVRPEEDVDLLGNKKCYFMNDNFTIIILCDVREMYQDSSDERETIKDKIPHYLDHFDTYFVSRFIEAAKAPAKPAGAQIYGQSGMHTVSFGGGNVTHQFHAFDYADIYDP
jgi:hypothetical protein